MTAQSHRDHHWQLPRILTDLYLSVFRAFAAAFAFALALALPAAFGVAFGAACRDTQFSRGLFR